MVALALLWEKGEVLVGGCDLKIDLRGKHRSRVTSEEVISMILVRNCGGGQIRVAAGRMVRGGQIQSKF